MEMDRQSLIASLRALREEFQRDGLDILYHPIPVALVLSDTCEALGLSEAETAEVLGEEVTEDLDAWSNLRMWQPTEKETAAQPVTELAAIPA